MADEVSVSSPAPASEVDGSAPRRSGRAVRKPETLLEQQNANVKRKRVTSGAQDIDGDIDMEDDEDDEDEDESEEEEEEEDERPKPKRARRTESSAARKTNGTSVKLPVRSARITAPRKPSTKKTARFSAAEEAGGLYADVFARGRVLDNVAADWVAKFNEEADVAVADLFTFTLRCAGCTYKVPAEVLSDPDSFKDRISEIQEQYQAENVTEYPLLSRARGTSTYKTTLNAFLHSLIGTIEKADILFEETNLLDNVAAWISILSSTGNRALRHTATYIAVSIMSALCNVGRDLIENKAKIQRQIDGERKKNKSNKSRVSEMDAAKQKVDEQEKILQERLSDLFEMVFVHRYRDVDPHIRLDCIHELSSWIVTYPDVYFEGSFLRYLGWLLSDLKNDIRLEVLKGLSKLFKDTSKLSGLEGFTEKFRPRIIEMATRDSDPAVRAAAIELLDLLREAQFLEPDDIDAVGRLIFDAEPRVRKAVVDFFVANVEDGYQMKLEEIGGAETVEELFGDDKNEEDYDSPRLEWLKLKAVVEQLQSYDAQTQIEPTEIIRVEDTNTYMLVPGMESRFSMAAEGICGHIDELDWQILAGYLLYDHSEGKRSGNRKSQDSLSLFKTAVRLNSEEETLLLEVLNTAVRQALSSSLAPLQDKTKKSTKAQRVAEQDALEEGARHLTTIIPRLLNRFGAIPESASSILRLEHVLSPENQDFAAYESLLDDIKKQFLDHVKPRVLEEASRALLHAKSAAEADDLASDKLGGLADDAIEKLSMLAKDSDLEVRGSLSEEHLAVLEGSVTRLEMLCRIEDIGSILDTAPSASRKQQQASAPIDSLLALLNRGLASDDVDASLNAQEDNIVRHAARTLVFYFLWKVSAIQKAIKSTKKTPVTIIKAIAARKESFVDQVAAVLRAKVVAEDLQISLAGTLIDVFNAFAGLAHIKNAPKQSDSNGSGPEPYLVLIGEVPKSTQSLLLNTMGLAEKALAKRSKKKLEDEPSDDEEPATDDEPEDDDEPEANEDDEAAQEAKLTATLVAEQRLCELAGKLVLGIWSGVLDGKQEGTDNMVKKRLKRNKTRLGHNFKAVVETMEKGAPGAARGKKPAVTRTAGQQTQRAQVADKSEAIVVDSDDESDEEEEQDAEAGDEQDGDEQDKDKADEEINDAASVNEEPESVLGD